jgi:O-antigen/teichoic acid export membrane protein
VAMANWIFPRVSKNDLAIENLVLLYRKSQLTLISIASISIAVFYLVKGPILNLWLGSNIYDKAFIFINAYCFNILFTMLTIIPSYFTLGTSNMKLMTANSIFSLALTGISMYVMFQHFGAVGLIYGRILAGFFSIPIFLLLFYKLVLDSSYKYIAVELIIPLSFAALMLIPNKITGAIAMSAFTVVLCLYLIRTNILKFKKT